MLPKVITSSCPCLASSFTLLSSLRRFAFAFALVALALSARDAAALRPASAADLGALPLYFVENHGQTDASVAYYLKGRDQTIFFTPTGLTFAFSRRAGARRASHDGGALMRGAEALRQRYALKLDFVGARGVRPVGAEQTAATFNYFNGPRESWRTGLPSYARVVYHDLWPGIDLVYAGTVKRMKYSFHVRPGADPAQIRLAYRGARAARVNGKGELEVETPFESFHDERPVSHQEMGGETRGVSTRYALEQRGEDYVYGFEVGDYDRTRELVIDPAVLVYAGYIGGSGGGSDLEIARGIALDAAGNAYITGETDSLETSFPVASGPDVTYNGAGDAFVVKVNAAGTAIVYGGYLGGSNTDAGHGIAVDASGNAYLTGVTFSDQTSFPIIGGPDGSFNGFADAFIAKVNASGTLTYCGYIGGSDFDTGYGVGVDASGNAYVAGYTNSDQTTFPETVGPDLSFNGGSADLFVAKINSLGSGLIYCGYVGGDGFEYNTGPSLAVDPAGSVYLTGYTDSEAHNFIGIPGPITSYSGNGDAFIAKVNSSGTALVYFGYIGGSGFDAGYGVAVDPGGNAYLTGNTNSTPATFPETVGPALTKGAGYDGFIAKINAAGNALVYAGYIGGSGFDAGYGVAADATGNAYVTGETDSSSGFPLVAGPDLGFNGGIDAFVAKVNPAGTLFTYSGYLGGTGNDFGYGIAVDAGGRAHVTGQTTSETGFPVTVGPDLSFNGGTGDGFVARVNSSGSGLEYCGYIGGRGSGDDFGYGIAVDFAGNAYITGSTTSDEAHFPVAAGPDLNFYRGGATDAFIAKINAAGNALVYAGYIGGAGDDRGSGIAVDASGNAYVTGSTDSDQSSFPVRTGPRTLYSGSVDGFIAKVNAAGTSLVYCGYIGGNGFDVGAGITVDGGENAYVSGETSSTQSSFPVTGGPDSTYNGGVTDVFIAKVSAAGTGFVYCGYIGGDGFESSIGPSVAVDASGNAYVGGLTDSSPANFPGLVNPNLTYRGGSDAFVAKVNATGSALVYFAYVGGTGFDAGNGVAVDLAGNAYLTGETDSTESSFPVTGGPDFSFNGLTDGFVAKINAAGSALVYAGYIGGSGKDTGYAIRADVGGNAYITGYTESDQFSFPTANGPDATYNGTGDAFVAKLNATGGTIVYSGYAGGGGTDLGYGIAIDGAGAAYLVGSTHSNESTFPDGDGFSGLPGPDQTHNGGFDAFVVKVSAFGDCTGTLAPTSRNHSASAGGGSISVAADPSCQWTAVSTVPWVTITAGANGSGNGNVSYSIEANPDQVRRLGSLVIAGQTFTVRQGANFFDVTTNNFFYDFIGRLSAAGVTTGCGGGNYCPNDQVTREQMAAFIIRALGVFNPPVPPSQRFLDVPPANFFYAFIEEMAVRGITTGCPAPNYCPSQSVTREQMAAFMIRALGVFNPPVPPAQRFLDVPPENFFYAFIEEMAVRGITTGCPAPNYCPSQPVTREQMAAFLVRAFGL